MVALPPQRRERRRLRSQAPMVSLIATDLDGTLLMSGGVVGDRTNRVLERAEAAGFGLVLVTGRPPRWMRPVTEQVSHRGVAICANGGIVMDLESGDVIRATGFPPEHGLAVLQALRAQFPGLVFGVEWADGFAHEAAYPKGTRRSELMRGVAQDVDDVEELFDRPVVKLLARVTDEAIDDLAARAADLLGDAATVTHSAIGLLEISVHGVTKGATLRALAADRGLGAADVIAFGDMPNDVPMLRWAGRSVAVANAHEQVLEVADEVTASNDEEGVADVIETLLN